MTPNIPVTNDPPEAMRQRGYLRGGWTSDGTILAEIRRDYLTHNQFAEVAFTRGTGRMDGRVLYWVKK